MNFLKQFCIKAAIEKLEEFTGILIDKKKIPGKTDVIEFLLANEKKKIKIEFGAAIADLYEKGDELTVAHIGRKLINISDHKKK